MVEICTESTSLRRKPHRRCCRPRYSSRRTATNSILLLWILATVLISLFSLRDYALVGANDDDAAAAAADDANVNNDDAAQAAGDDAAAEESNDDAAAAAETTDDNSSGSSSSSNSAYENEQQQYQDTDDDTFHWNQNIGFDGVSVMPLSCIN